MRSPKQKFLSVLLQQWTRRLNSITEIDSQLLEFCARHNYTIPQIEKLRSDVQDYMYKSIKSRLTKALDSGRATLNTLESVWRNLEMYDDVEDRIWSLVDTWKMQYHVGKPRGLGLLVMDPQSVHTTVVVKQTTIGLKLLMEHPPTKKQKTMAEIVDAWTLQWPKTNFTNLYDDMQKWRKEPTIYKENDYAYRYALCGAWAKIKTYQGDYYNSLLRRLMEECTSAIGMCAEGHMSRLVNVFIGFDDAFETEISPKERLANAMSVLAESSLTTEQKLAEGRRILKDLAIPVDEHRAWLEALE
jgi:hypothetical protein